MEAGAALNDFSGFLFAHLRECRSQMLYYFLLMLMPVERNTKVTQQREAPSENGPRFLEMTAFVLAFRLLPSLLLTRGTATATGALPAMGKASLGGVVPSGHADWGAVLRVGRLGGPSGGLVSHAPQPAPLRRCQIDGWQRHVTPSGGHWPALVGSQISCCP